MGKTAAGRLPAAVLAGMAAVVQTANCVGPVPTQKASLPPRFPLIADLLCAAIWGLAFGVNLYRWRRTARTGKTETS